MKNTKIFSLILALALLLSPFCTVYAAQSPAITVSGQKAIPGDEVTLNVTLSDNPGICTIYLSVSYDSDLVLTDVKDTGLMSGFISGRDKSANPYKLTWDDSLAEKDTARDGVLVKLTFRVKDTATPGAHPVSVTYKEDEIYNLKMKNVSFATVEGGVTVEKATDAAQVTTKNALPKEDPEEKETAPETALTEEKETAPETGKDTEESQPALAGDAAATGVQTAEAKQGRDYGIYIAGAMALLAVVMLILYWRNERKR